VASTRRRPLAALAGVVAAIAACSGDPDSASRRNVVLVTIDTLRADHLSYAGYPRNTSPRIDAFARRGTVFEWALSTSSYTLPSHASIMVGLDPSFHSVGLLNFELPLRAEEHTLAEICKEAGLRTLAVVSNFILRRGTGLDQGFEVYDDALPDRELVRKTPERHAARAVDSAIALLSTVGDERFLLWLHLQDPHGPYTPADEIAEPEPVGPAPAQVDHKLPFGEDQSGFRAIPKYQRFGNERAFEDYRARYDREIRATDRELGRLFDALDARGLLETTLVVVTADHGEALGEDDFYFAHCHSVGLDQVHVPLIIAGPGVRRGASIRGAVSNMDVFATILEFLDLPAPAVMHSRSLLATLRDGAPPPTGPVYCSSISQRGIAFAGAFLRTDRVSPSDKVFWRSNPVNQSYFAPLGTEAWSLAGPRAVEIAPPPELVRKLEEFGSEAESALKKLLDRVDRSAVDENTRRKLRALGYAD
jgi:arylsulfatase